MEFFGSGVIEWVIVTISVKFLFKLVTGLIMFINERALENRTPVLKHIVVNPADPSDDLFKLCCLNTRSLKNKAASFVSYAINSKADLFALTET